MTTPRADRPGGDQPAGPGTAPRPRHSAVEIAHALGLPTPTAEQRAVIEAPPTSMLVVAGAGSGKTETMSGRVVWLPADELAAPPRPPLRRGAGVGDQAIGRISAIVWSPRTASTDRATNTPAR